MEIHFDKGVVKVTSKEGFKEVQVCTNTGKVLGDGTRWDQFAENVHDLRVFHINLRDYLLPFVALGLFGLACTGLGIAAVPVIRRRRFRMDQEAKIEHK